MDTESKRDCALSIVKDRGWPILPVHYMTNEGACSCRRQDCNRPAKHPNTLNGLRAATTDVSAVRNSWAFNPDSNIGVRTGKEAGIFVIDVDMGSSKDGEATLANLESEHGPLPKTLEARTGGGGRHLYYKYPDGISKLASGTNSLGKHLDVRGDGGYVLAPPSNHASGNRYEWLNDEPVANAPQWLLDRLTTALPMDISRTSTSCTDGAPIKPARRAEIESALAFVTEHDDRDTWLRVGMALHHAGYAESREMWDAWSEQSNKYDPIDQDKTWDSFDMRAGQGVLYTLNSIFKLAYERGWSGPAVPTEIEIPDAWMVMAALVVIRSEAPEVAEMLSLGCAGGKDGHSLFEDWVEHLGVDANSLGVSKKTCDATYNGAPTDYEPNAIKCLLNRAKDEGWVYGTADADNPLIRKWVGISRERALRDFNLYHGKLNAQGRALAISRIPSVDSPHVRDSFTTANELTKHNSEKLIPKVKVTTQGNRLGFEPLVAAWTNWSGVRKYAGFKFTPVAQKVAITGEVLEGGTPKDGDQGDALYEMFRGLAIEPKKGNCSLIINHIKDRWCRGNTERFQYVINWLAHMFQKPDQRPGTALVLKSRPGSGKSLITDMLIDLWGRHAVKVSRAEQILGKFNAVLSGAMLVVSEEATWGGNKVDEGALKDFITSGSMLVERKYMEAASEPTYKRLIATSNEEWPVPMGTGDRRFCLLDLEDFDDDAEKRAYFKRLVEVAQSETGKAAFLHFLLNKVDISDFDPMVLPRRTKDSTAALLMYQSADAATRFIWDCLEEGRIRKDDPYTTIDLSRSRPGGGTNDWESEKIMLSRDALSSAFEHHCNRHKLRFTRPSLFKKLGELIGGKSKELEPGPRVRESSGGRPRTVWLPSLEECRARFAKAMGCEIDWPEEGSEAVADTPSVLQPQSTRSELMAAIRATTGVC